MKTILLSGLALLILSFANMTFAKSRTKSHKSTSAQKTDTSSKQSRDTSDEKQGHKNKTKRIHRCKLPNGKIDTGKTQQECLQTNGKWVKY